MPQGKGDAELADEFADFFLDKITKLREQFNRTPTYTSEGSYVPQIRSLKWLMDNCILFITTIVNTSLLEGVFSNQWKTSIARPWLKKARLQLKNKNYRPVSNLSFLRKLIECCAYFSSTPIMIHMDFQSAYKTGYSMEMSLLKLSNDILWAIKNQEVTIVVLLDLSAAFNTVNHDLMLSIRYGVTDSALQWYESYPRPRCMKVCVN